MTSGHLTVALLALALLASCRARQVARPEPQGPPTPVTQPGETPVSIAPAGLLEPGALVVIEQRLEEKGYLACPCDPERIDDRTRAALARFQKDNGLPTTGLPTYATVEKMELSVEKIFRKASPEVVHGADGGT